MLATKGLEYLVLANSDFSLAIPVRKRAPFKNYALRVWKSSAPVLLPAAAVAVAVG